MLLLVSELVRVKCVTLAFNSKWKYNKIEKAAVARVLQNKQTLHIAITRCCCAVNGKEIRKDLWRRGTAIVPLIEPLV